MAFALKDVKESPEFVHMSIEFVYMSMMKLSYGLPFPYFFNKDFGSKSPQVRKESPELVLFIYVHDEIVLRVAICLFFQGNVARQVGLHCETF